MISNILTAEERGEIRANEKWQVVITEKDAKLAYKDAEIEKLRSQLAEYQGTK